VNDLILKVNGQKFEGWKQISLRRSMESIADIFELGVSDIWLDDYKKIKSGMPCTLWFGDDLMLTGYIDSVQPSYDATTHSVTLSGRAKTADLVDCSLPLNEEQRNQYNNKTFYQVATILTRPFDIVVINNVDVVIDEKIRVQQIEKGQTVYEYLTEQARLHAVRLVCDEHGDLIVSRTSDERIGTALVLGKNILSAEGEFSMVDRFSEYHTVAQMEMWDDNNGAASAHLAGISEDVAMRYRPTVLQVDNITGKDKVQQFAEWTRNTQYGRSRQVTYTVSGWRHADGLWRTNTQVKVIDPWMGLDNIWMLIVEVQFVLDDKGQRTVLTLMPKAAMDLIPLPSDDQEAAW